MGYYLGRLDPFRYFELNSFIDKYSDWILFTILLMFFVSLIKLALRKRFEDSRAFRTLVGSLGLLMTFSMYYSIYKGWLHLNLLGLGLFGAFLLIFMVATIMYGLLRSQGTNKSTSLSVGYILSYATAWLVFPDHAVHIARFFPPLNTLLAILFMYSLYKAAASLFNPGKSLLSASKNLKHVRFISATDTEVDREMHDDKKEMKDIKRKTMKITKVEIKTIEEIGNYLKQMIKLIREKKDAVDQHEIAGVTNIIRAISKKEDLLKRGLQLMTHHINAYNAHHKKDIPQLQNRLKTTSDKRKRKGIEEEISYQQEMLKVLYFMNRYEHKIIEFTQSFNRLLLTALERLKANRPSDSLPYIKKAYDNLAEMKHVYEKQRRFEKYLLRLDRKIVHDLKREKS